MKKQFSLPQPMTVIGILFSLCVLWQPAHAQNVGIGTESPLDKLHVQGGARVSGEFGLFRVHPFFPPGANTALLATFEGAGVGPQVRFVGIGNSFFDLGMNGLGNFVVDADDLDRLVITPGGNVGIGVANPQNRLHVSGDLLVEGGYSYLNGRVGVNQAFNNVTFNLRGLVANERIFNVVNSAGTTSMFSVGPTGDVIADGQMEVGKGLFVDQKALNTGTIANTLRFGGGASGEGIGSKRNAGTGQYSLGLYTAGAQRVTVANNGNVGIGTISPAQKLHVEGNLQVNGGSTYLNGRVGVNQAFSNVTFNLRGLVANERIFNVVNSAGTTSMFSVGPAGDVIADGQLEVGKGLFVDMKGLNTGTIANSLRFGGGASGEGIGSKRNAGTGQYSLGLFTAGAQRMTVANNGYVGIGTTNPQRILHIESSASQAYIRRTSATGDDTQSGAYPLFVDGGRQGILVRLNDATVNKNNNYLSMWDANNIVKGRIEGFRQADYAPPNPVTNFSDFVCYVNDLLGPIPLDPISALTVAANIAVTVACLDNGVTYASGFGDYAEYLEMQDPNEQFTFGDIVGVKGGKITKDTRGAEQIMAISLAPIVLGNAPPHDSLANRYQKVAFMGQVPVKVAGAVKSGDFIVASGDNNGIGRAISPEAMSLEHMGQIVGRSWEDSDNELPRFVKVVVGLKANEVETVLKQHRGRITELETGMAMVQKLADENLELREKLARLENLVSTKLAMLQADVHQVASADQ